MFCEVCQNFMDITNNVSSNIEDTKNLEVDKNENNYESDKEDTEEENEDNKNEDNNELVKNKESENKSIISSEYEPKFSEVSESENSLLSDSFISEVLEGKDANINYKNFSLNDLNKNQQFNKLSNNQKTLVINRILEKLPKTIKISKSYDLNKESYNYCKTCGYYQKIKNRTSIFTRGNEKKNHSYNLKFLQYKNDFTLPTTKKYNCINISCTTHENPKLKYAVFFRDNDASYNIKYVCTICDSYWNTYIEK